MAVGLGLMFGFHFPENFNYPYIADSMTDFWRRWHLSLSTWFRDYVYIPLGGNRISPRRTYLNLLIVFFLCGFWHGATWNFMVWGLFHGAFLILERAGFGTFLGRRNPVVRHIYTLLVILVGWVFFRATTMPYAFTILQRMAFMGTDSVSVGPEMFVNTHIWLVIAAGVIGSLPWLPKMRSAWSGAISSASSGRGTLALVAQPRPLRLGTLAAIFLAVVRILCRGHVQPLHLFPFLRYANRMTLPDDNLHPPTPPPPPPPPNHPPRQADRPPAANC